MYIANPNKNNDPVFFAIIPINAKKFSTFIHGIPNESRDLFNAFMDGKRIDDPKIIQKYFGDKYHPHNEVKE